MDSSTLQQLDNVVDSFYSKPQESYSNKDLTSFVDRYIYARFGNDYHPEWTIKNALADISDLVRQFPNFRWLHTKAFYYGFVIDNNDHMLEVQHIDDEIHISIIWETGKGGGGAYRAESIVLTKEHASGLLEHLQTLLK